MRAAQINHYGGQDAISVTDQAAKPTPGEGQVLVEVRAAGINPFDWKVREGMMQQMGQLNFPATLGGDVAGVVAEVGPGVNGFEVGQPVFGQASALSGQGSFAEFTPVKVASLANKPESIDFVNAAAMPLTAASAYQALVDTLDLQSGQKILIHGGAGGIGALAVQLAAHLGAHVAATVSPQDIEFVRGLGAAELIDYKSEKFEEKLHDFDAVFDTVGGDSYRRSFQVLKHGGQIVSMLEQPDEALQKQYGVKAIAQLTQVTTERLNRVAELVDAGALKIFIDKVFPLDQAALAIEYLHEGHHRGRVVLKVKE